MVVHSLCILVVEETGSVRRENLRKLILMWDVRTLCQELGRRCKGSSTRRYLLDATPEG